MRFATYILLLLFSLSILGKTNLITFIKKIKSPIQLTSAAELDDETRGMDDDETKGRSDSYFPDYNFNYKIAVYYNYNKHLLNFYTLLFKSHFREVVTPPPELA
jgi:hypothetical protein